MRHVFEARITPKCNKKLKKKNFKSSNPVAPLMPNAEKNLNKHHAWAVINGNCAPRPQSSRWARSRAAGADASASAAAGPPFSSHWGASVAQIPRAGEGQTPPSPTTRTKPVAAGSDACPPPPASRAAALAA